MADPNVVREIRRVARRKRASPKEIKAALETGIVESGLRNLSGGDADSAGWRQERRSLYADPTSVTHSAERFFDEAASANRPGISAGELAADVQRPRADLRGKYADVASQAEALLRQHGEAFAASAPSNQSVQLGHKTTFDQAGFDQARKKFVLAGLLAKHGTDSPLFRSGLLSTTAPNAADFSNTALTSKVVGGASAAGTTGRGPRGRISVAPGAERAGAGLQSVLKDYVRATAGRAKRPITITTGTNHNRMTVDGNVSDHWDGHAADIGVPVDSQQGDLIAAHALTVAGVPWKKAIGMAQRGGLYTLTPESGQFKGHRVQVIWRTNQGGNHHNHVHVGVR